MLQPIIPMLLWYIPALDPIAPWANEAPKWGCWHVLHVRPELHTERHKCLFLRKWLLFYYKVDTVREAGPQLPWYSKGPPGP